jgi:hypothetical protein
MSLYGCAAGLKAGSPKRASRGHNEMTKKRKDKPWHLKVTWTLSIVMLFLIFGFFYQSFEEMLKIAPVQVAIERINEPEVKKDPDPDI